MRKLLCFILCLQFAFSIWYGNTLFVSAAEPIVIVIDPGHGGENTGTEYLSVPEKSYNMIVAMYMKTYLEQYQNVKVYLTHTDDTDLSLADRAEFAKSVNADFLFSLHFNMSIDHTLYGSEIWIPSSGSFYSQSYSIATEFVKEFQEMGLFNRGIKTRVGKTGDDYYGIIRQCGLRNIPAVIVEHCHVDHPNDISYIQSDEKLREFGERDAKAVARYFGLTSKDNKTDYSSYVPLAIPVPENRVYQDTTPPVYVNTRLLKYDKINHSASILLTALDYESPLQYYSYSMDGGLTWSTYLPWDGLNTNMTVTVNCPHSSNKIIFKVLNQYDYDTLSNQVILK